MEIKINKINKNKINKINLRIKNNFFEKNKKKKNNPPINEIDIGDFMHEGVKRKTPPKFLSQNFSAKISANQNKSWRIQVNLMKS